MSVSHVQEALGSLRTLPTPPLPPAHPPGSSWVLGWALTLQVWGGWVRLHHRDQQSSWGELGPACWLTVVSREQRNAVVMI